MKKPLRDFRMPKLTVSIVNYNTGVFLINCLKTLKVALIGTDAEVWVVDNHSSDDSLDRAKKAFPQFNYILNSENLGFGRAHNQVLKNLNSELVLILNPDLELKKDDISKMVKFMDNHQSVGAASPEILLPNGQVDLTAHRGLPTPWASFKYYFLRDDSLYHLTNRNFNEPHEVDAITGAFLMTRKKVLDRVGLFDEDYFMFAEDIDLCYRIKQAGFKVMYVPSVKILHYKGISTGLKKHSQTNTNASLETRQSMTNYFYSTMRIFYKKNLSKRYPFFINWLTILGINLKWFLAKRKLQV